MMYNIKRRIIKKKWFRIILLILFTVTLVRIKAQDVSSIRNFQVDRGITIFKLNTIPDNNKYIDIDKDGDTDLLYAVLSDGRLCLWIDDDDDMRQNDMQGDLDADCLLIDINRDGHYGAEYDLIIDYIDEDEDGKADIQIIVDNGRKDFHGKWTSHFLVFFDDDNDGIFSYIDWEHLKFEGWDHSGQSNFFADYHGKSTMLKVHITTSDIENLNYNWENPFLWYDEDNDGRSEMAIRVIDEPKEVKIDSFNPYSWKFSQYATLVQQTWDLDNDNSVGNELDFDMSLQFKGTGFEYSDQIYRIKNNKVLGKTDHFFFDARWRHLSYFVFPDHENVQKLTHGRGLWQQCWFVFDEDDDCQRWERVEFYQPLDPFKVGAGNGGLDNNPQADVSGDRGEWDQDCSGKGQLYISPMDGKIHLFGAEKGYWRIDQHATYYQGWQGWRGPNLQPEDFSKTEPTKYATVYYEDTDGNGFFDKMNLDFDGDFVFEDEILLTNLEISDASILYSTSKMAYSDMYKLFDKVADDMWSNAKNALEVANKYGLNTEWYAIFLSPKSTHEKYHNGYWLSYYLYKDMLDFATWKKDTLLTKNIMRHYFSSDWCKLK